MRFTIIICIAAVLAVTMHVVGSVAAYPLDGYEDTGIRRVEAARLAVLGKMRGRAQPPGALLPTSEVDLRLLNHAGLELPAADPEFSKGLRRILGGKRNRYGVAILDITDPDQPRYAAHNMDITQNVGSVGKIVVALGLFQALADIYPDDLEARRRVLRETVVTADNFIRVDSHTVRMWNPDTGKLARRPLRIGDQATLWEFLDWMLSASSNAAAAMVAKHGMLLAHYGKQYPVSEEEVARFFSETPRTELGELYDRTYLEPVERNGLDPEHLRQGSFFTSYPKKRVPGKRSYGSARELMKFIVRMEQGRIVDEFSSREIKRMLYMTERRIRYASSPALQDSAVYFKSGSLYKCKEEEGFECKKYHGNVVNYMNSLAIVESPAGQNRIVYMVTLISNVLRKNSAVDHQTIGTRIHRLLESMHEDEAGAEPAALQFGENLIGYAEKRKERMVLVETQAALLRLGFEIGTVDGVLGSKTKAAIRKFQKANKLKVDGTVSEGLLNHMLEFSPSPRMEATQ